MKRLLRVGMLSGLAGGAATAVCLATVGREPLRTALALEHDVAKSRGNTAHEELFSRGVQEIGGAIGLILFGLALGLIFAIVLSATGHRLGGATPMGAAGRLAAIGFTAVALVPFLKYPGNPPGVGDPATINQRTLQYLVAIVLSVLLAIGVWQVSTRFSASPVRQAWLSSGCYLAGLVVIFVALPTSRDRLTIPADVLWRFRLSSLAGLACGWAVMALVAGTLLGRLDRGTSPSSEQPSEQYAAGAPYPNRL